MALHPIFISLSLLSSLYLLIAMPFPCNGNYVGRRTLLLDIDDRPSQRTVLLTRKTMGLTGDASSQPKVVDVRSYGAKGDGSDSTQAFAGAWKEACSSSVPPVLLVPTGGIYLLKPITFSGSCKSTVTVRIQGTLLASPKLSDWSGKDRKQWIEFYGVSNLHLEGGGTIDGNGEIWWKKSCKVDKSQPCTDAPTAITFDSCDKLRVRNLRIKNSQKMHISFEQCNDVVASNLTVTARETSPNTDGIHVTQTTNILIDRCAIATGDDCISIVGGSQGVTATNIKCGPGHGISIGSLGMDNSKDYVSDVLIDSSVLSGTTNGARIKTWQGGSGYAKNITFRNIDMINVENPIIIDQNYCDSTGSCKQQSSAVAVSDVQYSNIKGTSATDVSIYFDCSKASPCNGIVLEDINLVRGGGSTTRSNCNNVKLSKLGTVVPTPCT